MRKWTFDSTLESRGPNRGVTYWESGNERRLFVAADQYLYALDPLTKELIYLAVSATNQCGYCIASHTAAARKAGMTPEMFGELMAVVGMANETNRLASGYQVPVDDRFKTS